MNYYILDARRVIVSGPHPVTPVMPANAYATDVEPPTPGEGQVVKQVGSGWALVDVADLPPLEKIHPDRIHRLDYATKLLTAAENDAWINAVDAAEQTPVADRTEADKALLRSWRHFSLAEFISISDPRTQGAAFGLAVFGIVTAERADQIARGVIVA